jgi:hypothetical protein
VEYNSIQSKEQFIELLLKKYSNIKKSTAERRYYELKKAVKEKTISVINKPLWRYNHQQKEKPHDLKILIAKDMVRLGIKYDRDYFQRHGFNGLEINWLVDEGIIVLDEK